MKWPPTSASVCRHWSFITHGPYLLIEEDRRMWRQISHLLHVLLYFGFPTITAVIGVYFTYRATQLDGPIGGRAYVIGIGLILGTWAWTWTRSSRHRASLEERVRRLEEHRDQVQLVLDTKTATTVVLEAVEGPPEDVPPWVHRHHHDASAPVIRMDPPGR